MTKRVQQVESTLRRAIAEVLTREISDPRIEGLISITRVKVTPDLRQADVFFSVLPESKERKVLGGLKHASSHIRRLVGKKIESRTLPHLNFRLDEDLRKEMGVYGAIQDALRRTGEAPADDEDAPTKARDEEE